MNHKSHLKHEYFMAIKEGRKRVEVRLNDSKRQEYQVDDTIKFIDLDTEESLIVRITSLSYYFSFSDLIDNYPIDLLGFPNHTKEEVKQIYDTLYSQEEQKKYHVIAIGFEVTHVNEN